MHEVIIPGPEGRMEGRYNKGKGRNPPLVILLHPHPMHGGNMNNKVIYNCFKTFSSMGFSVLRFNYRGVGNSEGSYSGDEGIGELTDAACALDWLLLSNTESTRVWVTGFSFGAFISLNLLMRRPEIEGFIAISPPADKYDFSFLAPCPVSGLIIQGDKDDIVNETDVALFANKLDSQRAISIKYKKVKNADHFFTNQLDIVNNEIRKYIVKRLVKNS
ncbi:MAG: alpha/beta hydrolase [Rickettsiales bacterium]|nr:alpha/beta hydrolase [Rickettsiales bacterium]